MPRKRRSIQTGWVYHVLNRGMGRRGLVPKDADVATFQKVLDKG